MELPYRLDLAVDLFEINVQGITVLLSESEMRQVHAAHGQLRSCWPEPKPEQVWAAVVNVLGRDPRRD